MARDNLSPKDIASSRKMAATGYIRESEFAGVTLA